MLHDARYVGKERVVNKHVVCCTKIVLNPFIQGVRGSFDKGSSRGWRRTKLNAINNVLILRIQVTPMGNSFDEMGTPLPKVFPNSIMRKLEMRETKVIVTSS